MGRSLCYKKFNYYLCKEGIVHQKSNPYTPGQNCLAERFNRTIVEKAKCLLFDAGLEKCFWAEAANTAVNLYNRTVASALKDRKPIELWTSLPDVSHLGIFGSTVVVHLPKEKRKKWDNKLEKCILVGCPEDVNGYIYRIYL